MKKLTLMKMHRIINALSRENKRPLLRFMRRLRRSRNRCVWFEDELLWLRGIEYFLLNTDVSKAQELIRIAGFDHLLAEPESNLKIAALLAEKGEEAFVLEVFSAFEQSVPMDRLTLEQSMLLMLAAEKALALDREAVALQIYRTLLVQEGQPDKSGTSPLLIAARSGNFALGEAYRQVYHQHLRYVSYKGGLEELVRLGDIHFVRIALECGANVLAPTSTGESILTLTDDAQLRALLLEHGAQSTDPRVHVLRRAMLSVESGNVDDTAMQALFSSPDPLLQYSFHKTTHPSPTKVVWDLPLTAARHRSAAALAYMVPHLKDCDDKRITQLLSALLGVDNTDMTPRNAGSAREILAVLKLLDSHDIRLTAPWDNTEEELSLFAGYNSKVACILDLACSPLFGEGEYPDIDLVEIAALLWKIGGIADSREGGCELLLLGLENRKMCLVQYCLTTLGLDFSLLDTDRTSAAWLAVGQGYQDQDCTRTFLQLVLDNGGNLNHQTATTGDTALHMAYRYAACTERIPVWLLLEAGANVNIRNHAGQRPKEVPQQTYIFHSGPSSREPSN